MFGTIREYKIQPGTGDALVERIRDEFLPMLEKAPGFVSYSAALVGDDGLVTTSSFETQQQAEDSVAMAAAWVKENMAQAITEPPRVTTGELLVRHVVENAPATYGTLRRFESSGENVEKNTALVRDGLLPLLAESPGFASYALLLESSGDKGVTLTAFADRANAEAASERIMPWVAENIKDAKIVDVVMGEIKLRHVRGAVATH